MKQLFYTDPHLGLKRQAGTTPSSSAALRARIYQSINNILETCSTSGEVDTFCLGDLFDKYSNDEATIFQAISLLRKTNHLMAGNHDIKNNADKMGSVQLLANTLFDTSIVVADFNTVQAPQFHNEETETAVTMIPHITTQELFEQVLGESTPLGDTEKTNMICLHCNYNLGFEMTDTTLNLSEDMAKKLLDKGFDYILLGHEHNQAEYLGGRVKIIGNPFPTSMSDIGDKRILLWDGDKFQQQTTWRKDTGYLECDWRELPEHSIAEFVKVTGRVESKDMQLFSDKLKAAWDGYENLLMLSNKVDVDTATFSGAGSTETLQSLPKLISESIEDEDVRKLWDELSGEVA